VKLVELVPTGAETSPVAPRYHWYVTAEVVASVAVTDIVAVPPLKMMVPCGCAVMAGVAQTFTSMVTLLTVPQVPVTRAQ